jgi:hypothetical protein
MWAVASGELRRYVYPSGLPASAWPLTPGWRSAGHVRLPGGGLVRLEASSTLSTSWRVSRANDDLSAVAWSVNGSTAYRTGRDATCIGFSLGACGNGFSQPGAETW